MSVIIDLEKCTGCGQCLEVCPFEALELAADKVAVKDGCTLCGACVEVCEFGALCLPEVRRRRRKLCLVLLMASGFLPNSAAAAWPRWPWSFWGKAAVWPKSCIFPWPPSFSDTRSGIWRPTSSAGGADKVYLVDHPALAEFVEEPYAAALTALARLYPPEIILAGATYLGASLHPPGCRGPGHRPYRRLHRF